MVQSFAFEKELSFRPTRLVVLIAAFLSIVAVSAMSAKQLQQERRLVEENVKAENRSRVQGFEQFVLRTLAVADLALRHMEESATKDIDWFQGRNGIDDPVINTPIFTAAGVYIPNRTFVSSRPELDLSEAQLTKLQKLAELHPSATAVSPPLDLPGFGQNIGVLRPLPAYPGGFAVVFLDPRRLTDFTDNLPFGKNDLISLIGLDGTTRARRTGDKFTNGEKVRGLVMERQMANPNGDYEGPSVLDGIPRYFSHQRLADYQLFATSGMPTATVDARMADARHDQVLLTAGAIAAILLGSGLIMVSIQRGRMRLDDLVQANRRLNEAQRIGSMGDWDYYPQMDKLHWSDNLRRMYGRSDDEIVSGLSDVARYVSNRDHDRVERRIKKIFATAKPDSWEMKTRVSDGSYSYRRVVAAPIFDDRGKVVGVHGTDLDITAEKTIREMEKKLSELARLDSMGALTATLAHELNQPLGIAANYLAAASRSVDQPEKVRSYLRSAQAQIDHLAQIFSAARELVSHSDSSQQTVDLASLSDEVIELLHETVKRAPPSITPQLAENADFVTANKAQLKQVLFNLCRNAIEAVPEGFWPEITIASAIEDDGMIRIEIGDNGGGFADTGEDHFAALVTSKKTGLGLGLALARTIVEHHGGKIWVKNSGPKGTTIALTMSSAPGEDNES